MYIHYSLLFAALMISWLAHASCLSNSSYNLLAGQQIEEACPSDGNPVCGLRDKQLVLFSNDCLFNAANMDILPSQTNYVKIRLYHCLAKVDPQKINKMLVKRGSEVAKKRRRPVPCTNVFRPVCGTYLGVKSSFKNECVLNAENVAFNRDWRIVKNGMCPEDLSKTRRRKDKPAHSHIIKKRSYNNNFNVSPSDLYVYMSSLLQDDFLNHASPNYHRALTKNEIYDEYLERIRTSTPFEMPFTQPEEPSEESGGFSSEETLLSPVPFSVHGVHSNDIPNKNLAHGINQQINLPRTKPISIEAQKQINYALKTVEAMNNKTEYLDTTTTTTTYSPLKTTIRSKGINKPTQEKKEEILEPKNECRFGSVAICAALTNGTSRTFKTLCEMMAANTYLEKTLIYYTPSGESLDYRIEDPKLTTWTKLYEGPCEEACQYNCSRDYEPVCVSKNGVNYTMINECYYNMAICLDKTSKWRMVSNKECERYSRTPDKYIDLKPGISYTSSFYVSETIEMTSTGSMPEAVTDKPLKRKPRNNKKPKDRNNAKREIIRIYGADRCCSRQEPSADISKCKCWSDTTQEPLSVPESQTESNIMSLVRAKDR